MEDEKQGRVTAAAHSLIKSKLLKIYTNLTIGDKNNISMVSRVRDRYFMDSLISLFIESYNT